MDSKTTKLKQKAPVLAMLQEKTIVCNRQDRAGSLAHAGPRKRGLKRGGFSSEYGIWQQIGIGGLCLAITLGWATKIIVHDIQWLPVTFHSELEANYGTDPHPFLLPIVRLELIADALWDEAKDGDPDQLSRPDRYATLQSQLLTPIASVTPMPDAYSPPQNSSPTPTLGFSITKPTASATLLYRPSATSTKTRYATRQAVTATLQPTRTRQPRFTNMPNPPTLPAITLESPTEMPIPRSTELPAAYPPPQDPYP